MVGMLHKTNTITGASHLGAKVLVIGWPLGPDLSGKSNSNGNLQGRASRQQSFSCRFDFPNRLRTVAAPSRCPCVLVEAPDAHSRVAPGAAYAYAKTPLREGPVGPYSDDVPWRQVQNA